MFALPKYTWDKDRETCKQCKHFIPSKDSNCRDTGAVVMLCAVNPYRARRGIGTCIDNRNRGPCGQEAALFAPK